MTSEHTERQDDSAIERRDGVSHSAHLRAVFPSRFVVDLDARGVVLGRKSDDSSADVAFEDPRMSRRHVQLVRDALNWRLVDLGSRNGVFVDGAHIEPHGATALRDNAVLRIGDSLLVFRLDPAPGPSTRDAIFPGDSPVAERIRKRIELLARSSGHVLILGETGTGKEYATRAIAGERIVPKNCAELRHELASSDLFGHVRGAFSGATMSKAGLVEVAADGVLFLDEFGELRPDVQGAFLRFLDDGHYQPVGATELRHSNARIIAATNADLDAAVQHGTFRRDLLARLRALNAPLVLPPLRERREDILLWASWMFRDAGVSVTNTWDAGAAECLLLHTWPENLRELKGLVRGIAATNPAWPVPSSALPEKVQASRRSLRRPTQATTPPRVDGDPTRDEVIAALTAANGNMNAVSDRLGIERTRLYRLCERHGIDFGSYRGATNKRGS